MERTVYTKEVFEKLGIKDNDPVVVVTPRRILFGIYQSQNEQFLHVYPIISTVGVKRRELSANGKSFTSYSEVLYAEKLRSDNNLETLVAISSQI